MKMRTLLVIAAFATTLATVPAHTSEKDKRGSHGHESMQTPNETNEALAIGVINSINKESRTVNITHEPVEALGWPTMTMDMLVTRRVDLTTVKTGEKAQFKLKKGRDKQFRIIGIEKTE